MHFFSYPEIQKLAAINNRVWFSVAMVVLSIASFIQRDDKLSYPLLINRTKKPIIPNTQNRAIPV